jgi:hypothetical protein
MDILRKIGEKHLINEILELADKGLHLTEDGKIRINPESSKFADIVDLYGNRICFVEKTEDYRIYGCHIHYDIVEIYILPRKKNTECIIYYKQVIYCNIIERISQIYR